MKIVEKSGSFFRLFFIACLICGGWAEVCTKQVCEYEFMVRETRSMMYRPDIDHAYLVKVHQDGALRLQETPDGFHRSVPNISVPLDKVHTVDGYNRTIITINDQFPGPTIEVMEGAEVVVTVVNELLKEGLSIHWHGIHMRQNPWMDGVPFVSQCPVQTMQSFQYRFIADPPGTHWYHSHFEMQKADGLFGALIIHRSIPSVPYFVMMFSDWFLKHSTEIEISSPLRITRKGYGDMFYADQKRSYMFDGTLEGPIHYWSGLVNGKGRHGNKAPLSIFTVKPGKKYVIHMINTGLAYPYRFFIHQHQLTVVESDGHRVKPVQIDSGIVFPGESYNFEFTANQNPGRYWIKGVNMRTTTVLGSAPDGEVWDALAILQYEGAESNDDPTTEERNCTADNPCRVLNCPWDIYSKLWYPNRICIPVSNLSLDTSFYEPEKIPNTKDDDVHEVFLNFGFPMGSAVNNRRMITPRAPLFQSPSTWGLTNCARECDEKVCWCSHVVELPPKKTIQVVLMAYKGAKLGHPVHIHGHSFQILKIGYPVQNQTSGEILRDNPDIVCENEFCTKRHWSAGHPKDLNFDNPPLKDTVMVPSYGYVVVRFVSDNPGYWFVHCHVGNHQAEGMALMFNESFVHQPPAPTGFPTCQKFDLDQTSFRSMLEKNKKCLDDECSRVQAFEDPDKKDKQACQDTWIYILITCCAVVCAVLALVVNVILWYCLTRRTPTKTSNGNIFHLNTEAM
ncbi:laccase-4-like [Actinia tenebrosa]|uniref:Laccase-4-like n=1 Tax=Actinia tenebrosa TaxID=6105 RepID=A0A6P8ISQ2_ACTTE|nr:laccase-4-like [Actinia tenebrosa]